MPVLTIELPETAYRDALTFAPDERARLAAILFSTVRTIDSETESDYHRETDEADLEAVGRSLEDEKEGRVIPGDVVLAQLKERFKTRS